MSGFIEGEDRIQGTLFPERLDDYVAEDNPVRVIDVFIDYLDVSGLGFKAEANKEIRRYWSSAGHNQYRLRREA